MRKALVMGWSDSRYRRKEMAEMAATLFTFATIDRLNGITKQKRQYDEREKNIVCHRYGTDSYD